MSIVSPASKDTRAGQGCNVALPTGDNLRPGGLTPGDRIPNRPETDPAIEFAHTVDRQIRLTQTGSVDHLNHTDVRGNIPLEKFSFG